MTPRRALETTNEETHILAKNTLAPDELGPTVCVGEILVEIVATTIGDGFLEAQPLVGPYPSGAPAIFTDQCGKFGGNAAIIGAVGNDDFGRVNLDRLTQDGCDVSAVAIDPELPTGSAFVRYREDGSRDFLYNIATSAAARFSWSEEVYSLSARAGHLHVMGSALSIPSAWPVIEKTLELVKSRGGTLSLDPNLRKELKYDAKTEDRFARLVDAADLLLPSGEELELAAGVDGEDNAVKRLFERGVKEIVLKRGSAGATCFRPDGDPINDPSFEIKILDPTGAGDCFGGAYVACRRIGLTISEALTYSCAAGARNVSVRGPMEGAGTRSELDTFIKTTRRLN
ncbi:sugar kinase [uncultured Roseibium sp.]|uniref:tagatose kinase n=1 Tax=uncultured Roseibium sp. TaxID=1936171 RepID=UPI0026231615|nr:sugar kinase [uncultured Roseibium sp.]